MQYSPPNSIWRDSNPTETFFGEIMDKSKKVKKINQKLCKCKCNKAEEPHPCPYSEEINDDHETLCTCCKECRQECIWDT